MEIINKENYYSQEVDEWFMSYSQFKDFLHCESAALAKVNGGYEQELTASLLIGSYVDAFFERTQEEFKANHPEIFKRDGSLKSEYVKAGNLYYCSNCKADFEHYELHNKYCPECGARFTNHRKDAL